jgi:hypothetical protein
MKRRLVIVLFFAAALAVSSCKKTTVTNAQQAITYQDYVAVVQAALKDSLSSNDYSNLDFGRAILSGVDSLNIHFLRVPLAGQSIANNFLLVKTDAEGHVLKGRFIAITRDSAVKASFKGSITYRPLQGSQSQRFSIFNGHVQKSSGLSAVSVDKAEEEPIMEGGDLPEVIVVGYTDDGGISYADWYCLMSMIDDGGGGGTSGYYSPSGGGGGGDGTAATVQVDFDSPENKPAIDIKKYLDCFGNISNTNANCTITIATDIPVDGDPTKFFNWSEGSPGHTYIELFKSDGQGAMVEQNIGFYPSTGWKSVGGGNVSSKLADDANHEYNAKYTITVTPAQFQDALDRMQALSSFDYNIGTFNCTDFALQVFNAAGGNLSIPLFQIPGFPTASGSNTPEGVYDQLNTMAAAGTAQSPGVTMGGTKSYGDNSHGPCN